MKLMCMTSVVLYKLLSSLPIPLFSPEQVVEKLYCMGMASSVSGLLSLFVLLLMQLRVRGVFRVVMGRHCHLIELLIWGASSG